MKPVCCEEAHESYDRFERLKLEASLGSSLIGAGLVINVGIFKTVFPDQADVAAIFLFVIAILVSIPIFVRAVKGVIGGEPHTLMEQLVALAILASLATGNHLVACLIPILMNLGHHIESRSIMGIRAAIEGLSTLVARKANLVTPDGEKKVDPKSLNLGDNIIIRPGEVVPADAVVEEGYSSIDQSSLTGEPTPEDVSPGNKLYAGTVNLSGFIQARVTGTGEESTLGRVLTLIEKAEESKVPIIHLLEKYAAYYVPFVLMVAGIVLFSSREVSRAIAILVVACPCALVLSSPAAMAASLATATRFGILIKSTKFLEVAAEVKSLILDKTGTVTLGHLEVADVVLFHEENKEALLKIASIPAFGSKHPVSRAIVKAAGNTSRERAESIEEIPGKGVVAKMRGETIRLGKREWFEELGFSIPSIEEHAGQRVWVFCNHSIVGIIYFADCVRPRVREIFEELRSLGISSIGLMSGDKKKSVEKISSELKCDFCFGDCLPEAKLDIVEKEKEKSEEKVMVIGDGINDALALARSDIGVAMGAMGSDVAINSADVALMGNDFDRIPMMIRLSRATRKVINQNICFGAGFSIFMLSIAAAGLISPIAGAILHNIGIIFVIFNSARLLKFGPEMTGK